MKRHNQSPEQKRKAQHQGKQGSPQRLQQRKNEAYSYYMNQSSPDKHAVHQAPSRQEAMFFEAKKVLDSHINFMTKGCYYFFRDSITNRDDVCMQILRDYNSHEDSDTLLKRCTDHYNNICGRTNERDYGNPYGERSSNSRADKYSRSPIKTTGANSASQLFLRSSMDQDEQRSSGRSRSSQGVAPKGGKRSYEDLKSILGFSNRYTYEDVADQMTKTITMHGDLNLTNFKNLFVRQFPEINKYAQFSKEGANLLDEALECLFNLMDEDRDGYVDQDELMAGLKSLFGPGGKRGKVAIRVAPDVLFSKMDSDQNGKLYMDDMQMFVQPQLRHIQQFNQIGNTRFPLTLSEMTHNCSLHIMRKTDFGRNGCVTVSDLERWSVENPIEYEFVEDLFNFAPDFIDKHRQIILQAAQKSDAAGQSPNRAPNNGFGNAGQQARGNQEDAGQKARQVLKARNLANGDNQNAREQEPHKAEPEFAQEAQEDDQGKVDLVKGKFESGVKETLVVKRQVAKGKNQRKADCSSKTVLVTDTAPVVDNKLMNAVVSNVQGKVFMGALKVGVKSKVKGVKKQDLTETFESPVFASAKNKIVELSKKSGLRTLNALAVAKNMRKIIQKTSDFTLQQFKDIITPMVSDKARSGSAASIYEVTLTEIFNIFDVDDGGTVDSKELANCLALMCGGSTTEKINAAFILFDLDNSGTMGFEELVGLVKTVFAVIGGDIKNKIEHGTLEPDGIFSKVDYQQLSIATAKKAFSDLRVPMTGEINYQQFVQWITGESLYDEEELEALERTAPPSKSKFSQKKFANAQEWCKRFIQEEEYIDNIMKMREEGSLENISLVAAKMRFDKYRDAGVIDKPCFMKEMRALVQATHPDMSENQTMKVEATLQKMYRVFDIDKNGILDVQEVAAALVVLCKGSIASKVKFGIQIFSSIETETDIIIKYSEFRSFIFFIFKLSLETSSEILLDYDLNKLADQVATQAYEFSGVDKKKGNLNMNQVMQFLNKVSDQEMK